MFLKSLRNFFRCFFCPKKCYVKYRIGKRRYYPGYGYRSLECLKDIKKTTPYYGMSVKEIREEMKKDLKDDENQKS